MIQEYDFKGKVNWCLTKPNQWGKYTLNFYPPDAAARKAVKETGVRNKTTEDDDGGLYYVFRSDAPFVIKMESGEPFTGFVGNGSEVTLRLSVEAFTSKLHGEVVRSKVVGITIHKLVEYVPVKTADLPEPAAQKAPPPF